MQRELIAASEAERAQRDGVIGAVIKAIAAQRRIPMPTDGEPSLYGGEVAGYRYQLEGEDDLLHVSVERADGEPITPLEGQRVFRFLLPDLPTSLVWLKPGEYSQHFYFGHDDIG